jgi:hypothetical protein
MNAGINSFAQNVNLVDYSAQDMSEGSCFIETGNPPSSPKKNINI